MHRKDHRARAAAASQLEARSGDRLQRDAATAELGRDEGRQRPLAAQRLDRLGREARVAVDRDRVGRRELVCHVTDGVEKRLVAVD